MGGGSGERASTQHPEPALKIRGVSRETMVASNDRESEQTRIGGARVFRLPWHTVGAACTIM